jgi:hypothetical protein
MVRFARRDTRSVITADQLKSAMGGKRTFEAMSNFRQL